VTRRLVFRPEAEAEIVAAADWYESRSAGLAAELIRAVDAVVAGIQRNPLQHPEIRSPLRRALLRRFPYSIIYRVAAEEIVIAGCLHWRQHPRRWQSRS
jgi:plasmid stabilization system protein ParE